MFFVSKKKKDGFGARRSAQHLLGLNRSWRQIVFWLITTSSARPLSIVTTYTGPAGLGAVLAQRQPDDSERVVNVADFLS